MIKKRIIKRQTERVVAEETDVLPCKVEKGFGRAILKKISPFPVVDENNHKNVTPDKN